MIYLEKNDIHSTLTTWIYCHFWMMYSAEQIGQEVYINWPEGGSVLSYHDKEKFSEIPNMYDWYFKQPKILTPPPRETVWTWETWKDPIDVPLMSQPLKLMKYYFKKYLKFSDAVEMRGRELVNKYQIDFNKTIGLTWRGTDIKLDGRPRIPIETYFPFIDDIFELYGSDFKIVCTAEETGILEPLFKRYPNAMLIEEFEQVPFDSDHNPERFSQRSGFERGLQPALMVWLFSQCAHYIKNRSSTGAVASWLSNGRIVSLGHPENLGFYKDGKVFSEVAEINGYKYPLYR